MADKEMTISEAVAKAKADIEASAKKRSSHDCCAIEMEGDGEIKSVRAERAENGFTVSPNWGDNNVLVKNAKEAGEAVEAFLS